MDGIVGGGRLLVRPLLRWIVRSSTPRIFTAASLLRVAIDKLLLTRCGGSGQNRQALPEIVEPQQALDITAGFGR